MMLCMNGLQGLEDCSAAVPVPSLAMMFLGCLHLVCFAMTWVASSRPAGNMLTAISTLQHHWQDIVTDLTAGEEVLVSSTAAHCAEHTAPANAVNRPGHPVCSHADTPPHCMPC